MGSVVIGSVSEEYYESPKNIKIVLYHERKDKNIPQRWDMFIRENQPIIDFETFKDLVSPKCDVPESDLILYGYLQSEGLIIPKNGRIEISAL